MNRIASIIFFLLALFISNSVYSQHFVKGKIINSKTEEVLAFVNILFNNDPHSGTSTDIDGKFQYRSTSKIETISCSYVGYEPKIIRLDSRKDHRSLIIKLQSSAFQLEGITVIAGENPANRIIRKVIENKKINNPENVSSFKYRSYNKLIYDIKPGEVSDVDSLRLRQDSIQIKKDSMMKGGHLMMMESVTERKFIYPDKSEETILGTKVSGFKHPSFALLATDIQPFSFYKDIIKILDINYLNPISKGSLKKYNFRMEDTLYQNKDTIFIISFKPKPKKNFDGLTGLLYVNTNKYAIQNVIAEPIEKGFIDIKIQQKYQFLDNKQWFPEQLNFESILQQALPEGWKMSLDGKSYFENIELGAALDKKDFAIDAVQLHELANDRDSLFWIDNRVEALNEKELATYEVMDSLGEEHKFDALLKFAEKLALAKVSLKFVDIDLSQTLVYNKHEGLRLGLGLYTNEKVFKSLSLGGFFGYGLKDHKWKYGGEFIWEIDKDKEFEISAKHQNTLRGAGKKELDYFTLNYYDYAVFLASRMDRIKQNSIAVGFRAFKYAQFNCSLNHTIVKPLYEYEYQSENQQNRVNYTYSDVNINLRYAFREKLLQSFGQRVGMGTKYPVLSINYSKGIKGLFDSEFDYNKLEARIEKSFYSKKLGETKIRIDGGIVDKPLPYGLLFTGDGTKDKSLPMAIRNSFQTAEPYEFLSDRYVNFHFSQHFKALLLQIKKFKPHISLIQSIGWGSLSNPEAHQITSFKTKEKGLFESGLQIDNILKLNYLNVAYLGFGGGVYYRYGAYAHEKTKDNLAFKFSVTFTTK